MLSLPRLHTRRVSSARPSDSHRAVPGFEMRTVGDHQLHFVPFSCGDHLLTFFLGNGHRLFKVPAVRVQSSPLFSFALQFVVKRVLR
jgi:hypothetical protein